MLILFWRLHLVQTNGVKYHAITLVTETQSCTKVKKKMVKRKVGRKKGRGKERKRREKKGEM